MRRRRIIALLYLWEPLNASSGQVVLLGRNNPRGNSGLAYCHACGAFVATTGYPTQLVHAMLPISQIGFSEITGNAYTALPRGWEAKSTCV